MTRLDSWLAALDERHLANLTPAEVARALRALSSCYVERRAKLEQGGALEGAGKRAAFALFYAPLHFFVTREIVRRLPNAAEPIDHLVDLGCGTGTAGVAWALEASATRVTGFDRHPWAISEANWTYRVFAINGHATRKGISRVAIRGGPAVAILAAYTINELQDADRAELLSQLLAARRLGARVLIVEPIARRLTRWWGVWHERVAVEGGRADEWRFRVHLPPRQQALARAAGLDTDELTARSLYL